MAVLRALGIRRAADDVVPVAPELAATVRDVVDPPEPGQPLSHADVRHIQDQIASASHPPPTKPRTGNPSRVAAASAHAAGAVCEAPEGAGAAGTQGAPAPLLKVKAVDRNLITPREGTRIAPPRPKAPMKEPNE